ncbi:MAG: UvrD-helicase domain-containing protein [Candidatus Hydrogenedentes bacterium]|nr:UvrD-helicase domain-containing protein [Candidatus Hydrogenedentota bacterium]
MSRLTTLLENLNTPQQEAVQHTEGPLLVLAGAGSGKTRVITRRIAYILAKGLAAPSEILAVTFTNKAANEMRERVAELVGAKNAAKITVSTFHAFCVKVLRQEIEHLGYRRDFTISSESDVRTLMRRVLANLEVPAESLSPQTFQERIGMMKNADREPGAPAVDEAAAAAAANPDKYDTWLADIYESYQSALRAANALDFDDLLLLTLRLLREHPRVLARYQERFRYVLVDEFQDTNTVQYELLRILVDKSRNLCVVGDDDQSIYAWRGADPRNILEFHRRFPGARVITLDQNYRSTEMILNAANHVIANNQQRREKRLWSSLGAGRPIDWIITSNEEHEAKMVASWLKLIQSKTGAKAKDFAVLYRSNQQSRPLETAFRQSGIPYVVVGGQDFFERAEVKDIISYLKVIANPRDEAAFLRVINMPRRGVGDTTLHHIHDLCRAESLPFVRGVMEALQRGSIPTEARRGINEFLGLTKDLRSRLKEGRETLKSIVTELAGRIKYREELDRTSKSPEQSFLRWSNVEAVINAVGAYEAETKRPSLSGFLDESSLNSDGRQSKDDRSQTGATLMTIHSAKGLEFPFVFITGAEEGLLPHERSLRDGAVEEERRLFYVALTRGKRHVTIFESVSSRRASSLHGIWSKTRPCQLPRRKRAAEKRPLPSGADSGGAI